MSDDPFASLIGSVAVPAVWTGETRLHSLSDEEKHTIRSQSALEKQRIRDAEHQAWLEHHHRHARRRAEVVKEHAVAIAAATIEPIQPAQCTAAAVAPPDIRSFTYRVGTQFYRWSPSGVVPIIEATI